MLPHRPDRQNLILSPRCGPQPSSSRGSATSVCGATTVLAGNGRALWPGRTPRPHGPLPAVRTGASGGAPATRQLRSCGRAAGAGRRDPRSAWPHHPASTAPWEPSAPASRARPFGLRGRRPPEPCQPAGSCVLRRQRIACGGAGGGVKALAMNAAARPPRSGARISRDIGRARTIAPGTERPAEAVEKQ